MPRGKYIVFEGGEGCGKTTQVKLFCDYLDSLGSDFIYSREPGGTPVGEGIRTILLDPDSGKHPGTSFFLFEAARVQVFEDVIIPSLEEGKTVMTDRSGYSTLAYQGYGHGVDLDLIKRANKFATKGITPDLLFVIDIDPRKGLENLTVSEFGRKDAMESQGFSFHERVNAGYLTIAEENPNISVVIPYRENDVEGMQEEIRRHAEERLFNPSN